MKNGFDTVLFDFDGTLVDSSEGIFNSLIYAFRADGKEAPDRKMLRKFIGPPIYESFKTLFGYEDDKIDFMIKKYRERYSTEGYLEAKFYDGIPELLKELHEKGIKVATASSKPTAFITKMLEVNGLSEYIDYIGGTLFDNKEPGKTGIINNALQQLGCTDKSKALMVGDRKFDIDGAKGAGIKTVAVLYGFGSREEFSEHGAEYIAENVSDVRRIIFGE